MPERTATRILIVGGVAGGASAATRARRLSEEAKIVVFERGEHISFANCGMPYHIGGVIADRDELLVATPERLWNRYRIRVRLRTEVEGIDRDAQELVVRDLQTGEESREPYDVLILSPGAEPIRPPIPGADLDKVLSLRSLADMDGIKAVVDDAPERAVIIGGGYIGLEMAEALRERGVGVTIVELSPQVFGPIDPEMAAPIHRELERNGVELRLGTSAAEIAEAAGGLRVTLSDGGAVECGLVIMAIGVRPEAGLARDAGLAIGASGGIVVDEHMRTSDPRIFAVGDAVEVEHFVDGHRTAIPLAGPANRQGRIAADNALGRDSRYERTQGTAVCKVFGLTVGLTGLSEKHLKRAGADYEKVYVHPSAHAGYYPGSSRMTLKLLFSPRDGKVLGAQAVGRSGVDKRIDVLAVAIRAGMTVRDLQHLELSYAPPYGSAKDPVNYAGFVAANVLDGDVAQCHAEDVAAPGPDQVVLDIRTKAEVATGTIPGSMHVPLDELRDRLGELPKDKELLVFCGVGLRGYLACRILDQNGFRSRNLSGGLKTYKDAIAVPKPPSDSGPSGGDTKEQETMQTTPPRQDTPVDREIDARAMQCPGPIMRLSHALEGAPEGTTIAILAGDPGFPADVAAWCESTGNTLLGITQSDGECRATVAKGRGDATPTPSGNGVCPDPKKKTLVVFSGDLDKVMASFIIANGAVSMGSQVTMFFTFWGLNALRRHDGAAVSKGMVERMFGWMMPRGADRLGLSKMNMGGLGRRMMKSVMRRKNVASLPELIEAAQQSGVRMVACSMSMDVMGIKSEELIDGIEEGGVATYLNSAEEGNVNLFI